MLFLFRFLHFVLGTCRVLCSREKRCLRILPKSYAYGIRAVEDRSVEQLTEGGCVHPHLPLILLHLEKEGARASSRALRIY